jgi:GTP-binding protein HflX
MIPLPKIRLLEKTLLIGVKRPRRPLRELKDSIEELDLLIQTAGGTVIKTVWQEVRTPNPAFYIGKGKVREIAEIVEKEEIELVAVDEELTPVQNRNLEEEWGVRVVDRTAVILDIFALRAHSKAGKLQVELAQLEYLAPRLVGRGVMLSQQVGRIGTRGPGETQLEYDRRRLRRRVDTLRRRLEDVRRHRHIHRQKREGVPIPLVSLVGYTNAGKSTIMNALTRAGVYVEDRVFSTLDPTVRRFKLPSGREILLADTVGFIKKLPHQLVASFKATFEEMAHADLLLEVVDMSDSDADARMRVVTEVLGELELSDQPRITVYNKSDLCGRPRSHNDGVVISALKGDGLDELIGAIDEELRKGFQRVRLKLKHDQGEIMSTLYRVGNVLSVKYFGKTVRVDCEVPEKYAGKYKKYIER